MGEVIVLIREVVPSFLAMQKIVSQSVDDEQQGKESLAARSVCSQQAVSNHFKVFVFHSKMTPAFGEPAAVQVPLREVVGRPY